MRNIKFTDGIDADSKISLYEYGWLRNPANDKTLVCLNPSSVEHSKENPPDIRVVHISLEDVKEALEEAGDGYYSFIGSDKETELKGLCNEYLIHFVQSLSMYNGIFLEQFYC